MEAVHSIWQVLSELTYFLGTQLLAVLAYPLSSNQRIYLVYLASSLLFAIYVYSRRYPGTQPTGSGKNISLGEFLFPASIWSNPSAWLDVRYFFFHQIVRLVIYGAFMVAVFTAVFDQGKSLLQVEPLLQTTTMPLVEMFITGLYFIALALLLDFVGYGIHYLQHRIPLLWEFHKLHHSATVMHPLTNYREHPVDNIVYAIGTGTCMGLMMTAISAVLGYVPSPPKVLGLGLAALAFNLLGYNLRHSHIWLKWPGSLSYLFGSPAHHQVHHSCHPEHVDKNFAFMFPVWDVLFGTYCVPETNKDVRFGLSDKNADNYQSCLQMYWLPLRRAFEYMLGDAVKPSEKKAV